MDVLGLLEALQRAVNELPDNCLLAPVRDDMEEHIHRWKPRLQEGLALEGPPRTPYVPVSQRLKRVGDPDFWSH